MPTSVEVLNQLDDACRKLTTVTHEMAETPCGQPISVGADAITHAYAATLCPIVHA